MNKRLIGLFVAVAAVVVIVVVCCVMFVIDDVTVTAVSGMQLSDEEASSIVADSGIEKGSGIFSVDESAAINAIEKNNPAIRVIAVERVFPNDVDIRVARRTGVVAIPIDGSDRYAVVDRDLKIVSIAYPDGVDSLAVVDNFIVAGDDETLLGSFLTESAAGWLGQVIEGAEMSYLVQTRFGKMFPSVRYRPEENRVILVTVKGCAVEIPLDGDIATMFNYAWNYYSDHVSGTERENGGRIVLDAQSGGWTYVAN